MEYPGKLMASFSSEHYWLEKLKTEFHFSSEEAKVLKDKMRCHYEHVYLFCQNDNFENFTEIFFVSHGTQDIAYKEAMQNVNVATRMTVRFNPRAHFMQINLIAGLTSAHLRGKFLHSSENQFLYSLSELINDCEMEIQQALNFIFDKRERKLEVKSCIESMREANPTYAKKRFEGYVKDIERSQTLFQLSDQISKEKIDLLTDNDSEGLNLYHVQALVQLTNNGLRSVHVRGESWFNTHEHIDVLSKLITLESYSVIEALQFMRSLQSFQIYGLAKNLSMTEVSDLKNEVQVRTLIKLKNKGVTAEKLKTLDWFKHDYQLDALNILLDYKPFEFVIDKLAQLSERLETFHLIAIDYLSQQIDAGEALSIVIKMNTRQALCVTDEIPLKEIIDLNEPQANALRKLYPHGLRGHHVRNETWFNCHYHCDVLCYLVRKLTFTIDNALKVIKGSSWLTVLKMMNALSKLDFDNLNNYQVMALLILNGHGLEKKHLEGRAWFNSIKHRDYLVELMVIQKMPPEQALQELQTKGSQAELRSRIRIT